jgi:hypothetical protein
LTAGADLSCAKVSVPISDTAVYVQWFLPDEDMWCFDELDDDRWSTRHIEMRARDQTFVAAASLAEFQAARDPNDRQAVIALENRYGVVPDAAFPTATADDEPPIEPITAERFEELWRLGRQQLARADASTSRAEGPGPGPAIQSDDSPNGL